MKAENYSYSPRPFAPHTIEGGYRSRRSETVRRILVRLATPAGLLGLLAGYALGRWL